MSDDQAKARDLFSQLADAAASDDGCAGPSGMKRHVATVEEGKASLQQHAVARAFEARAAHGPIIDCAAIKAILGDDRFTRYPTQLVFDASQLHAGEFAAAIPRGERPSDGYTIVVHPRFADRNEALPLLVAYHLVVVNYGDIASDEEALHYAAGITGLPVEEAYERICALADSLTD
ncbi:MAG: hypothetical protein ACYTF0_09590 [Planctomycetota bacterium]|jgi:hypothetical protein